MKKYFLKKPLSAAVTKQLTGVLLTALCAQNAVANDAEQQSKEDDAKEPIQEVIVVTAQYRKESILEVPIAISAFGQDFIEDNRLKDIKDVLDFTPGFAGKSKDSFIDTVSIRGISSNDFGVGGDPSVGIFKDGVYQGRNGSAVTSFFDTERVEALRGPQGFLYGRNAISGTISLTTNKPHSDYMEGLVSVDFGQRGMSQQQLMLNLPLNDEWSIRFAGYNGKEDGYVKNHFAEDLDDLISYDNTAFRVSLGYTGDDFDAVLRVESEKRDQSGSVYIANDTQNILSSQGISLRGGEFDLDSDLAGGDKDDGTVSGVSLTMNWDLDWAILTSISAYREHEYEYAEDYDGSPALVGHWEQEQDGDYLSQEVRLVSSSDGPLNWIVGASAYRENIKAHFANVTGEEVVCQAFFEVDCSVVAVDIYGLDSYIPSPNDLYEDNFVDGTFTGYGVYANVVYAFTDKLKGDFGLRYSYDNKEFAMQIPEVQSFLGPFMMFGYTSDWVNDEKDWGALTPRATLTYKVNKDWSVWGSVTEGYKSGGFGSSTLENPFSNPAPLAFEPEVVWSYETGVKASLLDNKLLLDTNAFYYEYTDLQLRYWDSDLFNVVVDNVGKVVGQGIEGSIKFVPNEYFDIYLGASYMDTEINEVPDEICTSCDGNRLRQQPKVVFSSVANFTYPMGNGYFFVRGSVYHQSEFFGEIGNSPLSVVDGYTDVALAMGYDSEAGWSVTGYVDNVFDERYWDGASSGGFPYPAQKFGPSRPRTFGVNFSYYFSE